MVEIAKRNNVSERTIYRYKEYKRSSGIYADVLSSLQLMQDYGEANLRGRRQRMK